MAALSLLAAIAGCRGADPASSNESGAIRLGLPVALSGAVAQIGKDAQAGVDMAVQQINDDGGLLDREVEVVARDTQSEPRNADSVMRKMAEDGVDVFVGPSSSAEALAGTEVSRQFEIPMLAYSANTSALTTSNFQPYFFSLVPNALMEAKAQAVALADLPGDDYAILAPDYEGGRSNAAAFKRYLGELAPDADITVEAYPPLGETDFAPYINKLRAAQPDHVFSVLFGADLIAFTKQAQTTDLFSATDFVGFYDVDALSQLGSDAPEGVRAYERAPFFALESQQAQDFVSGFVEAEGRYPSNFTIMAYDAVMVWAQSVRDAGSTDADAVVQALEAGTFETLRSPEVSFRELDHQANVPEYFGLISSTADPDVPFPIWTEIQEVPGSEILPSEAEVEAASR